MEEILWGIPPAFLVYLLWRIVSTIRDTKLQKKIENMTPEEQEKLLEENKEALRNLKKRPRTTFEKVVAIFVLSLLGSLVIWLVVILLNK